MAKLDSLANLSPEERELAIKILRQYSQDGKSDLMKELEYGDYEEVPVDIDTFLDDPRYLGDSLWDIDPYTGERHCTLFPYWRQTLHKLFPDSRTTAYNTLILAGAIGLGKTECAVIAMCYLLYRMLCLKDPYSYYGMQSFDKITFSMLNITLDAAQGVGWSKIQQLLQKSSWFMSHGTMNSSSVNPQWQPNKGIELIFGSNNRHIIGRALYANVTDEVNFTIGSDVEKKKARLRKMISQIDARMQSRFMRGTSLPTLNIVISSADSENSFLQSYINLKKQNESKTTLIIEEPQWVVRPDKGSPDDPGSFYVAIGNKFMAHELLPVGVAEQELDKYRERGYRLLKIPPGYRENFEDNLEQSLMDIAGMSSTSSTKFISGVRLNQAKRDYQNPFTKDVIEVGNAPDDHLQYANFFDMLRVNPRDKTRPLFIHLDMSISGDKTGIAGVWITGRAQDANGAASTDLCYKTAFSVSVKAPKGYQVSFEKNRNFIRWLRDQGFAIKSVSADTFQSAPVLQALAADGFATKITSVDRVDPTSKQCLPYHFLKQAIYEQKIQIYRKCDLLTDELIGLERLSNGHVDHTPDGINSKDQSDAVCGALFDASQFSDQYSYEYGDSVDAAFEVNSEPTSDELRRKYIEDFQSDLAKSYLDAFMEAQRSDEALKRSDMSSYIDVSGGIIAI